MGYIIENCSCCSTGILDCNSRCPGGIAKCWTMTVAGIVDNACPCDIFNGTFTLAPRCGLIFFRESNELGSGLNTGIWSMRHVGSVWQVKATIFGDPCGTYSSRAYEIDEDDFNCNGKNLFVRQGSADTANCNTNPATITVSPTACPSQFTFDDCGNCSIPSLMVECWELAVAGITTGTCHANTCAGFNGTFTFTNLFCNCNRGTLSNEIHCTTGVTGSSINRWFLTVQGGNWVLFPRTEGNLKAADYRLGIGAFDCTGSSSNVFTLFVPEVGCNGWPSSVTLDPILCP